MNDFRQASSVRDRLSEIIHRVELSAPSVSKFSELERFIANIASTDAPRVYAAYISKPGNMSVRFEQSPRVKNALIKVAVCEEPDGEALQRVVTNHVRDGRSRAIFLVHRDGQAWVAQSLTVAKYLLDTPDGRAVKALAEAMDTPLIDQDAAVVPDTLPIPALTPVQPVSVVAAPPLEVDARVMRMLRLAVATHPAVLLVGPPGTGKSSLLTQVRDEIAATPSAYGMTTPHEILTVTPDESWGTRELVGGESVDDRGRLRFSPGWVLEALSEDRWLTLDEANRADMDRIFGGLLTWLAGQEVTVGRLGPGSGAAPIRLGWSDTVDSHVEGLERLMAGDPGSDPVTYRAGREWRLLGTYNSLDAHRVFRLGMALGRRFRQVPVPAPGLDMFSRALEPRLAVLPNDIRSNVAGAVESLYQAHLDSEAISLGPALFLDLPSYVAAGLDAGAPVMELLSEAYLLSVGPLLARLEEDSLDRIGSVVGASRVLGDGWGWVRSQLRALA